MGDDPEFYDFCEFCGEVVNGPESDIACDGWTCQE